MDIRLKKFTLRAGLVLELHVLGKMHHRGLFHASYTPGNLNGKDQGLSINKHLHGHTRTCAI